MSKILKEIFILFTLILSIFFTSCEEPNKYGDFGKKGQGGGFIFFSEGGQFKECSGELGRSTWYVAVTTANDYRGGGYSDWRLPNRSELDLIYKNLKKNNLGGFSESDYWSSESYSSTSSTAWYFDFYYQVERTRDKTNTAGVRAVRSYPNEPESKANLLIKNQSFTEITDVIWQGVSFANNQFENSIKTGTSASNSVEEGASYIFFKRKSNPITARTNDLIIIEKDKQVEFTFTDNTLIVEVNNTQNNGTLGALNSTVVWWDDAEGEMQPYYEARSLVCYYETGGKYNSGTLGNYFYEPKNGKKSIAIGRENTALLHLKIDLKKEAKLSFWYANKYYGTTGTIFKINNIEVRKWTTDVNWSFMEFNLEPGVNDLIWEKKDGGASSYRYLSLDDLLIYYTE